MNRRCLGGCGALIAHGSYCTTCKPEGGAWSKGRDRTAQARFRRGLLNVYGQRCCWTEGNTRCPVTTDLRACHVVPLRDGGGYELSNGVLLCKAHDKATDRYAR
jgi:5-methylcytosine-specific restriction endonuclease McrA